MVQVSGAANRWEVPKQAWCKCATGVNKSGSVDRPIQKVFSCSGQNLTEVRSMFGHFVFYFIGQMPLQCRTHKESQDLCAFIGRNPISILLFLASLVLSI